MTTEELMAQDQQDLRALREAARIGAAALEELIEHGGDDLGDTRAADLAKINAAIEAVRWLDNDRS